MDEEHGRRAALGERVTQIVGFRRVAPRVRERHDLAAERPPHLLPALAELPLGDREHALGRREQVDDRRLEGARSRGGQDEDLAVRAKHFPQPLLGEREDLGEVGRAVVQNGLGEGLQHLGWHRGRARRQELLCARHDR